jgi:putative transposase
MTVGRTWVRELLKRKAYEALQRRRELKHRIPPPLRCNLVWGGDTTCVRDAEGRIHEVLGIVDHGSRLCVGLRCLRRFNAWTFLGCVFLAIGQFGKPITIKTDNHPVFRSRLVKQVLRWVGIRQQFSRPASPWENGRIERFFGTLKSCLQGYVVDDARHLVLALSGFRDWYNVVRPHQHLGGATPAQVWNGIDPFRRAPKAVSDFRAWGGRLRGCVLRH